MRTPTGNLPTATIARQKLRLGFFTVEALNSLAASYYFNYIFFYLTEHFGFGNRDNLLISALYGLIYMLVAWQAGPFGQRRGYFFTLRLGFWGMAILMIIGGLAPLAFGYSHLTRALQWFIVALWTLAVCLTWPTLQALFSEKSARGQAGRTAGIYNVVWAGAAAIAYLTSGALLDTFGGEILFWLSAALNLAQLALLPPLQKLSATVPSTDDLPAAPDATATLTPRPIARSRKFLHLAWLANPFAYVGIYGVIPIIPKLAQHFDLTPTMASLICSVWFWSRLGAFLWFWLWPGWHYRLGWLLGAFIGLIASFIAILLSTQVWMLAVAQIIFGLAVGLIYYSSLFYSMDGGESKGKKGGFHEAAIGLGIFIGPTTGVATHHFLRQPNSETWGISALLILGLILFLAIHFYHETKSKVKPL
ncbi:MAG TPA: MFS transporter [Verrucomicrobiae bacterium]|jgi:MFS family permease|nr:MFS transporter [Verrucomicrobiae bacterium]